MTAAVGLTIADATGAYQMWLELQRAHPEDAELADKVEDAWVVMLRAWRNGS